MGIEGTAEPLTKGTSKRNLDKRFLFFDKKSWPLLKETLTKGFCSLTKRTGFLTRNLDKRFQFFDKKNLHPHKKP